jgi:DNA sulfur modification protein DndE
LACVGRRDSRTLRTRATYSASTRNVGRGCPSIPPRKGSRTVAPTVQAGGPLIHQKTRTGIGQWNILCRWAFCLSLRQPSPPTLVEIPRDSNVELSWQVFGGEAQEQYLALLKERCEQNGQGTADEVLARQFRLYLHRGIASLATPHAIRPLADPPGCRRRCRCRPITLARLTVRLLCNESPEQRGCACNGSCIDTREKRQ